MRSFFFLIVFLNLPYLLQAQQQRIDPQYGLAFASHEVTKDHRTGLNLNPDTPYIIEQDFSLSFDFTLQRLTNAYGYIVRIIANDTLNIDLMCTPEHDDEFNDLTMVINNKPMPLRYEFADVGFQPNQWTTFDLHFSFKKNTITILWKGKSQSYPCNLQHLNAFRFYFGVNDYAKFSTSDAPPMVIKNITLKENNTLNKKWLLQKHNHLEVYDSVANSTATVVNPRWLIDKQTKWVHRKSFNIGKYPSIAFNNEAGILYATDERNLYQYDLRNGSVDIKQNKKGHVVFTDANQLLYVNNTHALVNYDVFSNKIATYDFTTNTWGHADTTYLEPNYWHNNKFYNAVNKSLYVFGGYGHFTYKNNFFRYDEKSNQWETVKTSGSIPPRYLSAAGIRESTGDVLIFGGYGSMSGKQELSPQSFYDLYKFNLTSHAIEKIRSYAPAEAREDIVFSNSLIINEEKKCFYTLSYPKNKYDSYVQLRQYALENGESKIVADSIPFRFHDEDSFCDLFLSPATNELIAVLVYEDEGQYQVNVHAIQYPPMQAGDVLQAPTNKNSSSLVFATLFLLPTAIVGYVVWKRRQRVTVRNTVAPIPSEHTTTATLPLRDESKITSAILLLGGFQVLDKKGVDISSKFTMTLKELFTIILLHSIRHEKGISATEIQEHLWPEKDEVSARNNRNVNIKKLRALLDDIGGISVENNNAYLNLTIDDFVFCDYQTVYRLLHDNNPALAEGDKINILIRHVTRGSLLPNMQSNWLDNFKSEISNQIIDALLEYSQKLDPKTNDKLLLEIADAIFAYDTINQEALVIKCSVLNKKGKYSLAKTWYDHFVKEYKNLYAENYPKSFDEVIS
ncbi:Kelch repeat-containing protein [Pseudochryseolinea flava]|uniref:Galactose oxidase n=1 Tax=Pseudochryseolinea flava TaxID=2059302 RepID=A0A364XXD7_9BACT|nr:kelch repeat-containing protein [Pseudochryseolinea flava]RAV98208.1 hypothetical protein DQQ10_24700 [Pseudochryseolinea flava]